MGTFNRLGMNFDPAIFGSAVNFTEGQSLVYTGNTSLNQWQINDLNNSTANGYFQNPMANNLSSMAIIANNIVSITSNTSFTYGDGGLPSLANNFVLEIANFTDHTNRLSNITQSQDNMNLPDYGNAMAIGRQVLAITNQTDNVQNNTPILGNFTSLTTGNTIASQLIYVTSDYATLNSSITVTSVTDPNTGNVTITRTSNLTSNTMNSIVLHIQSSYNTMNTYRTNDVNFYKNSISLVRDHQTVSQFSTLGVSSEYLLKNYIGTPKLISNLS
jgi:hypothetical protein